MPSTRRHRRLAAWVTLVALVLATLAPGVARALAFANADALALGAVCSADGAGRDDGRTAPAGAVHQLFDHCPFCALHTDLAPPAPAAAEPATLALRHATPALFLRAHSPLFAWEPAQARAPPAFA